MCNYEFPLSARWSYYLVERILDDVNEDVHFAWRFDNEHEATMKLIEEAASHPNRTYQIFKSID